MTVMKDVVYRGFDQGELDVQYSPSSCVPDIGLYLSEYSTRSRTARETLVSRTYRYGHRSPERIEFFPGKTEGAPLHVFLHGGFWQELGIEESSFAAPDMVRAGCAFAVLGYGLAPHYDLDDIVAMVRGGLSWLASHPDELGVAPGVMHVSGHSAGAHLLAMAVLTGAWPNGSPAADMVTSATLLSGVYDLEPIRLSYINEPLGMSFGTAWRNSPMYQIRGLPPPLLVARGGRETGEFRRQHDDFVAALRDRGFAVEELVAPDRNHFDLPFDLADPTTLLGSAVLARVPRASCLRHPEATFG